MEAAPAAALEMPEANFLFKHAIIAFDAPAQLGCIDQFANGDTGWLIEGELSQPAYYNILANEYMRMTV